MSELKFNIPTGAATLGLLFGIGYGMKTNKGFFVTALIGIGFGLAGLYIGNRIDDFKENALT